MTYKIKRNVENVIIQFALYVQIRLKIVLKGVKKGAKPVKFQESVKPVKKDNI